MAQKLGHLALKLKINEVQSVELVQWKSWISTPRSTN